LSSLLSRNAKIETVVESNIEFGCMEQNAEDRKLWKTLVITVGKFLSGTFDGSSRTDP
jgi:hypothetical protein